jgi:hypothetical protein
MHPPQIWQLPPDDRVDKLTRTFDRHWRCQLEHQSRDGSAPPSLTRACVRTVRGLFLAALPAKLLCDASQFVGPVALNALMGVVEDTSAPAWLGHVYAGLMFTGTLLGGCC